MIHSPSWFTARMKDSRNCPKGRSDARPCSEGLAPVSTSSASTSAEEQLGERVPGELTPLALAMLNAGTPGLLAGAAKGSTPGDAGTAGPVRRNPFSTGCSKSGDDPRELGVSHWPKLGHIGLDGETSAGAALGCALSACRKPAAGRPRVSLLRIVSRTKSCSHAAWRKRTSVLAGWTLTSTSSGGISTNSSTTGNDVGARILR